MDKINKIIEEIKEAFPILTHDDIEYILQIIKEVEEKTKQSPQVM